VAEAGAVHRRDGRRELLEEARRERLGDAAVGRALDQRQEIGPADELPLLLFWFWGCFSGSEEEDQSSVSGKGRGEKGRREKERAG